MASCSSSELIVSVSSATKLGRGSGEVPIETSSLRTDQFDDTPEQTTTQKKDALGEATVVNPLEALALACVAEKNQQMKDQASSPTTSFHISQNDVLCGRGGLTNHHPGNVFFRKLVRIKQESYLLASKREKAGVAREIVEVIRSLNPPGRFLKKDQQNPGLWVEIGDRKAREKTSQALREGAPELREELQTAEMQTAGDFVGKRSLDSDEVVSRDATLINPRLLSPQYDDHTMQLHNCSYSHPHPALSKPTVLPNQGTPMKPLTVTTNRARVVSDDAGVLGLRPLFHQIQGNREELRDVPGNQQQPHVVTDHSDTQEYLSPLNLRQLTVRDTDRFDTKHGCEVIASSTFHDCEPSPVLSVLNENLKRKTSPSEIEAQRVQRPAKRGPRLKLLKSRLQSAAAKH